MDHAIQLSPSIILPSVSSTIRTRAPPSQHNVNSSQCGPRYPTKPLYHSSLCQVHHHNASASVTAAVRCRSVDVTRRPSTDQWDTAVRTARTTPPPGPGPRCLRGDVRSGLIAYVRRRSHCRRVVGYAVAGRRCLVSEELINR